jgi:UDP-N-acetylglucosamine 2-epimerase (non-hydrolysing)
LVTKKTWCNGDARNSKFIPKLAHVEAGLRSFDRTMPEEINRIVTDSISDYLFTTEESGNRNLESEGISSNKIHFVGNVMIDTLLRHRSAASRSTILNDLRLINGDQVSPYAMLTLHRPGNVDDPRKFADLLTVLLDVSRHVPIIFPAHPRTLKQIQDIGLEDFFVDYRLNGALSFDDPVKIRLVPPLGYLDFLRLASQAKVVFTDSGGVQEETTILGIPCITLRDNTERPVTVERGTNVLVGSDRDKIIAAFMCILNGTKRGACVPQYWDGLAAERVVQVLVREHVSGGGECSRWTKTEVNKTLVI